METKVLTLTEFLQARIAEDESDGRWVASQYDEPSNFSVATTDIESTPVIMVGNERWLADCEAKRRIVERCAPLADMQVRRQTRTLAHDTLRALALPFADHPDFRQEWRP